MYGVSAVQMAHNKWFDTRPRVLENEFALSPGLQIRPAAQALMDNYGVRGEIMEAKASPSGSTFRIERPGTVFQVSYDGTTGQTRVRTNTSNLMGMLNRIHHIGGLWHGLAVVNVWGFLVAVVSAGLMVLSGTGIYMWFKLYRERVIGIILLAASLGYSLTVLALIRTR
jgi:hypothetical protein